METERFFSVSVTQKWIETKLDYMNGASHADVAKKLPLKAVRVKNDRYCEIETTGHYYRITEEGKGGKAFIFEIEQTTQTP